MRIARNGKCGLVSRLTDFLTCRFFSSGIVGTRPRGTSIVIALGLIAAISAFTIGIASTMLIAIQNTSSSKKALQAEYSAQGGEEMVRKELKAMGVAYGPGATTPLIYIKQICADGSIGTCPNETNAGASSYFNYTVKGKDDALGTVVSGYRSVPVAGSGNAGSDCKIGGNIAEGSDHPCHWNKLYYGDSVEIPLYVVTKIEPDETVTNFANLGINRFFIKVRTPCEDGGADINCSPRYSADFASPPGAVVVNWQISGMCGDPQESCGIAPTSGANADSSIREEDLNDGKEVIDFTSDNGVDVNYPADKNGVIINFLKNLGPWAGNNLSKPVLKLSFVNEITDGGDNIPYLEYQILYTGGPLAASYTISINGFAEGFLYSLSGVQSPGAGLFDFAVQN